MFATALDGLLGDEERRRLMGSRGRAIAERNTWERVLNRLMDTYHEIAVGATDHGCEPEMAERVKR
jgi:glycosyltransferase involved in cell wall biosynthesis